MTESSWTLQKKRAPPCQYRDIKYQPGDARPREQEENKVTQYKEILRNLRRRGISYSLNFIFGWDTETENVFDSTLAFLREEKVPVAYFNILVPHKGTPVYDRLAAENRIIDMENMDRWPGIHCCIKPKHCSPERLEEHVKRINKKFYTLSSMLARLPLPVTQASIASWIVDLSERRIYRARSGMEDFDSY